MATTTSSYSAHAGLTKVWKTVKTHTGIFTGGKTELFVDPRDGRALMACMLHDDVAIVDAVTGELQRTLQQDIEDEEQKESFVVFAVRPARNQLVTAGRNLLLRVWDLATFTCVRTIKAHQTPVLAMDFDPTGTLLATGSSDRTVKVFDVDKGFCTHNFRKHTGIVTVVKFHPDPKRLQLVSCSDDATVRVWDLYAQQELACIADHMNPATCVAFANDGYTLLTSGRDRVVNFWDLRANKLRQTALVHEGIEGIQVLPDSFACVAKAKKHSSAASTGTDAKAIYFVTAGEEGALKLWCLAGQSCQQVLVRPAESESLRFSALLLNPTRRELVAVSVDQNLLVFNDALERTTQIIGFNDDILNLKYVPNADGTPSAQLAAATNSDQIRLLNRDTMSCELLSGHSDIVMALAVSPDGKWLVSASKDRTAKVWNVATRECVATCPGHTEALGAIAISQKVAHYAMGLAYFVTGSADKTLKMWSLKPLASAYNQQGKQVSVEVKSIVTLSAVKAHDKDVNAIAVSPNDRLVASASQDKLIKVWSTNDSKSLTLVGTCRGHKRGVWAVEFSPVDQCIASASGDKTVKVWSAKDFSCLKTFEGHTASVLNVQFVCAGMQLVSAGADGLVKLWTIKSNECEATLDNHIDKIWALAVAKDGSEMASGGADSTINLWRDFTEEEEQHALQEKEAKLLKEQELFNCLRNDKLLEAVQIAFELGHPHRLLQILMDLLQGPRHQDYPTLPGTEAGIKPDFDAFSPEQIFAKVVTSLSTEQLKTLFDWAKEWNTNARHTAVTQTLISTILREIPPHQLKQIENFSRTLDALIAYSDRHFQRIDRMLQKSYLVDFSVVSMKNLLPVDSEDGNGLVQDGEASDHSSDSEAEATTKRKRHRMRPSALAKKLRTRK